MKWGVIITVALLAFGCASYETNTKSIVEVSSRENHFPTYPQGNTTYLSLSPGHGFQVNFLAPNGKAWLWYPGNQFGVPEDYKTSIVSGQRAICWRHPTNSYNPVTKTSGGGFQCENLALAQRTIVASLPGDVFSLKTGLVPYTRRRCDAPQEFNFDRTRFSC